jgi:hypothetical protein
MHTCMHTITRMRHVSLKGIIEKKKQADGVVGGCWLLLRSLVRSAYYNVASYYY